ncbi:MAG: hypothetical protein HGA76_10200 [Candidatus Firestonebacteria bacterium]|nr:hypothetical protein [Candidatus Firestonebacteria bacterium]
MPADNSNIKGSCIKSVCEFVKADAGEQKWQQIIEKLPALDRAAFFGVILPSKWYPIESYFNLLREIEKQIGGAARPDLGIEIGKKIIADGLNSFYRMMMGILNTSWILTKAPSLWKMYFDKETLTILHVSDGRLEVKIDTPLDPPKMYCCAVMGGILQALESSGGRQCRGQEVKCRANHEACCEYHLTWQMK